MVGMMIRLTISAAASPAMITAGESADLEHGRVAEFFERTLGLVHGAACPRLGGGDAVLAHEVLGKDLRPLQLRREAGGSEDGKAALLELVDDAESEGELRADDR